MDNHRRVKALIDVVVDDLGHLLTHLAVERIDSLLCFILKHQVFAQLWMLSHEAMTLPSVKLSLRMESNLASFELTLRNRFKKLRLRLSSAIMKKLTLSS